MLRRCAVMVVAVIALSGCRVLAELVEADGDGQVDAATGFVDARSRPDADVDCGTWTYTPTYFDPCDVPPPAGAMILGAGVWTYDTNSGALTNPEQDVWFPASTLHSPASGPELRIVSVDELDVQSGARLEVYGKRPAVFVSWSSARVIGVVDATGTPTRPGAGADPALCASELGEPGENDLSGGGGGGGAGFGASGGDGGDGASDQANGGNGGSAQAVPNFVRGGCPGARGGNSSGGAGGTGGGAVVIVARDFVQVEGTISSGGIGGRGGEEPRGGGGGGGSGGFIALEGASVVITSSAVVAANGGAGGGGSDNDPSYPGQDGQPGTTAAVGGDGRGMGEDGGDGGAVGGSAQDGRDSSRGAGGGGGGVGFILLHGPNKTVDPGAEVSPAARQP